MTQLTAAHPVPSFGTVLTQQLRLLWLSRRPALMLVFLLALLAVATGGVIYHDVQDAMLVLRFAPAILLVSLGWSVAVWREEGPPRRMYHWGLPVDMATHDRARVIAGALWLLAIVAAFVVAGAVIALFSGEAELLMRALPLLLPHYLLSSITVYLLVVAVTTASKRPLEWLLLGFVTVQAVIVYAALAQRPFLMRAIELIFGRPYGLGAALGAGVESAEVRMNTPSRVDVGQVMSEWLPAVLLWLFIGSVFVAAVTRWRRGRA